MDSNTVELNTFAASNVEPNDDNVYSTDHPLYPTDEVACEQYLKDISNTASDYVPGTENDEHQKCCMDSTEVGITLEILYKFYAEFLISIAGISLFIELLPGPIQLFESHVYIFILLLCVGIIFLLYGIKRNLLFCNSHKGSLRSQSLHKCSSEGRKCNGTRKFTRLCLKLSIFVFGVTVLISTCMESLTTYMTSRSCMNLLSSSLPVLQFIFIFLQMIFIITNSKDTYNLFGCCHKLVAMHLIATNIALCVRMFIWGSALDWENAFHIKHDSGKRWERNDLNISKHALEIKGKGLSPDHVVHVTSNCWWRIPESPEMEDVTSVQMCLQSTTLGFVWAQVSHFFYPIMFQYYALAVCFLLFITCHCKLTATEQSNQSLSLSNKQRITGLYSRSTKGLSLGFLVFTSVIIYVIMYFTMENLKFNVILMSEYCFVYLLSITAGLLCIFQIRKLSLNNEIDDLQAKKIQKIGIIAVNLYGVCDIVGGSFGVENFTFLLFLEGILMIIQTVMQYVLIIQISKKKVDASNILEKPGRQCVAFLMLCNISLWVLDCFVSWGNIQNHLHSHVLGQIAWHLIARILFPIIAFYRLHSTAVFFKAWKSCYF